MPCNTGYLGTKFGILEIFQIVFSTLAFICALVVRWIPSMSWCIFVGIFCAVLVLVHLLLNLLFVTPKIPKYFLIMLVGYLIMTMFSAISTIVAAVAASNHYRTAQYNDQGAALISTIVFFFLANLVLLIDLIMQFRGWRVTIISQSATGASRTVTSSTVTTTTRTTSH